jgi:hypothetical protein
MLERLEDRSLLTALPFGAYPDDSAEYMLGDVQVTVVLMESDPSMEPQENSETWTGAAISAVKSNIQQGLDWWETTLDNLPNVRDGLLNFNINWTYADTPVRTGYEPIARTSNDFVLWIYDFLNFVNFNQSGNYSSDLRAFNNFQRQQNNADWAFTIFVVNDANDADHRFAPGGTYSLAFANFAGRFLVAPASRPASTFTHETGHMFWALDEYSGGHSYTEQSGYYNTANSNATGNPGKPGEPFIQQPSIMLNNGALLDEAFNTNTTSQSSKELIGWRDSDADGIFDVLDVPFTLTGTGRYDAATQRYRFTGSSKVNTLGNLNSDGLQNDITINRIRQVEYSVNGGPWTVAQTFPDRTYTTSLDLSIPLVAGSSIKIRTIDTRTGVTSNEFVGNTTVPRATDSSSTGGFVFRDDDSDGVWDANEPPLADWAVNLVDVGGAPVQLVRGVEPNDYLEGAVLNTVIPQATLQAIGGDTFNGQVLAKSSSRFPTAQRVFYNNRLSTGAVDETWSAVRKLRVDFSAPVSTVSLRALSSGGGSIGRLEAYNAAGELLARYTTSTLAANKTELMTVANSSGNIAYVVAYGHMTSDVLLDSLTFGPGASATTNAQGYWSLPNLLTGNYRVQVAAPTNYTVTSAGGQTILLPYTTGQIFSDMNFGLHIGATWRNPTLPETVNNDAQNLVNAFDLLAIVNWIVAHPGDPALPPPTGEQSTVGYLDVDGNGLCNAFDLLAVVNYIVSHPPGSPGEGAGEAAGFMLAATGDNPGAGAGEGDFASDTPRTAAEYYAQNPIHLREIPGTDLPCCCAQCLGQDAADTAMAALDRPALAGNAAADSTLDSSDSLRAGLLATASGSLGQTTVSGGTKSTAPASGQDSPTTNKPLRSNLEGKRTSQLLAKKSPAKEEQTLDVASTSEARLATLKTKSVRRGTQR